MIRHEGVLQGRAGAFRHRGNAQRHDRRASALPRWVRVWVLFGAGTLGVGCADVLGADWGEYEAGKETDASPGVGGSDACDASDFCVVHGFTSGTYCRESSQITCGALNGCPAAMGIAQCDACIGGGQCIVCGDGVCSGDEFCGSCPSDCGDCVGRDVCGDGTCSAPTEDCLNCAGDCGACPGPVGVAGSPAGLVCGMAYERASGTIEDGYCTAPAFNTIAGNYAPGYVGVLDGDTGLSAGFGFSHQALESSTPGVTPANGDSLILPRGTACGFGHSVSSPSATCLGFSPWVACPIGWVQRYASDASGGGATWAWCESLDPNAVCDATCVSEAPSGIICGISHNKSPTGTGYCDGVATTDGCPPGWQQTGFHDWGQANAGQGIGYCYKP